MLIRIHPRDNVAVDTHTGHKQALCAMEAGQQVVKYGYPIGLATQRIASGEAVHTHNLKTLLDGETEYTYHPNFAWPKSEPSPMVEAYLREDGRAGIRNDLWILPTVGCVNALARQLAEKTGSLCFPHPYGCSQLGGDLERTQRTLAALARHPNAGGVLVLGLGCENNRIAELRQRIGPCPRVRYLNTQDVQEETGEGLRLLGELKALAQRQRRQPVPLSALRIGLKCGGSDGLSGITANPLLGRFADRMAAIGGGTALSEVPEMFGAEALLLDRCVSREVFDQAAGLLNGFKRYFISHGQPVYENPSPGNRDGGITTLEEKSLGCTQKGGSAPITGVLSLGEPAVKPGLTLVEGPGNDLVSCTHLAAAGCVLILFTTGRGTPLSAPVPTIKISSNTGLALRKPHWIDLDAGPIVEGQALDEALWQLVLTTCRGQPAKGEAQGWQEMAIWKDGVTL